MATDETDWSILAAKEQMDCIWLWFNLNLKSGNIDVQSNSYISQMSTTNILKAIVALFLYCLAPGIQHSTVTSTKAHYG